jgi:hypothetical protein
MASDVRVGGWRSKELDGLRDERGSVLIFSIIILVAVGLLIGALATLATPIFSQALVTRNLNKTGAGIDAGIEYGIQTLQTFHPVPASMCPDKSKAPAQLTNNPSAGGSAPASPDNYVASVYCQNISPSPSNGISTIVLTSSPPAPGGPRVFSARAVIEVNDLTGATTILSWRTCQDPQCLPLP